MTFHPGDEVICVNVDGSPMAMGLREGAHYTISDSFRGMGFIVQAGDTVFGEWDCVTLCELPLPVPHIGFRAEFFRPVRKTDISIFTQMLTPKMVDA